MTASVSLADSWRMLLQFADSPELGTMVRKTIAELERAADLEKHAVNLAWAIQRDGARLYNEAVLVTAVGSLPIRVRKQFEGGRKLGKTHQNVLVFCKGDPRKATEAVGPVEVWFPDSGQPHSPGDENESPLIDSFPLEADA